MTKVYTKDELLELAFDSVPGPLTDRVQQTFIRLISPIEGESVLDLGSGSSGYFWALGYVNRVEAITFSDRSQEYLDRMQKRINLLIDLNSSEFDETLFFLKEKGLIRAKDTINDLAKALQRKSKFIQYDFVHDKVLSEQFDFILSFGSIACIDRSEELDQALQAISKMLKKGACLNAIWTPYIEKTALVEAFIKNGIEGTLNPQLGDFEKAFKKTTLNIMLLEQIKNAHFERYSTYEAPIYMIARK